MGNLKLGLINGRHPLPVERYLIDTPEVPFDQAHIIADDAVRNLCNEINPEPYVTYVDLYITGLTRAALAAVGAFIGRGVGCNIYEYNTQSQQYETVMTFSPDQEAPWRGNNIFTITNNRR